MSRPDQATDLVDRTRAALQRWGCERDGGELRGGMSVVIPVRSGDGTALMLKLLDPVAAAVEARALRAFPASASVRCLEHDDRLGALLLERLTARSLASAADPDEKIIVQAQLAHQLAVPDPGGIPRLADTAGWLDQLAEQHRLRPDLISVRTVGAARETIMDLGHDPTATVTHGDLHAANVHEDASGRWRALDPTPRIGTIAHESHTVVVDRDRLADLRRRGPAELRRRLELYAAVASVDPDESARLCRARAVSSALHEHLVGHVALADGLRWVAESLV